MYSKQLKTSIKINEIVLTGDTELNEKIITYSNLKKNTSSEQAFKISFKTKKNNNITSKDSLGNPLTYTMTVSTNLTIYQNENVIDEKNFSSSFSYSNKDNKFDLREYQKKVEKDLIKSLSEKINTYFTLRK